MSAQPDALTTTPPLALRKWYLITATMVALEGTLGAVSQTVLGRILSAESSEFYNWVLAVLVGAWLVTDPKFPADKRPSFDHGFLLWVTFPCFALYQLFTTRRWRGVLILLGLTLLFAVPNLAFAIVYTGP